jgi:hypothetical protein
LCWSSVEVDLNFLSRFERLFFPIRTVDFSRLTDLRFSGVARDAQW